MSCDYCGIRTGGLFLSMVEEQKSQTVMSIGDIITLSEEIKDKKKEFLLAITLNARGQIIRKGIISVGTVTASLAHPREIFAPAIADGASGIILVHNHPSGDPSPSEEDVRLTKRVYEAGLVIGIPLLDHVIVGTKGAYSFKTANNGGL